MATFHLALGAMSLHMLLSGVAVTGQYYSIYGEGPYGGTYWEGSYGRSYGSTASYGQYYGPYLPSRYKILCFVHMHACAWMGVRLCFLNPGAHT